MQVIGHRGSAGSAPENTLPSFEVAAREGADAIEFDIALSANGTAWILHDESLQRTTGLDLPIAAASDTQLAGLDAGSWFSPAFAGTPIPRLFEVAQWIQDWPRLQVVAEFKGNWTPQEIEGTLADLGAIGAARLTVEGFELSTLEALQVVAPHLSRALATEGTGDPIQEAQRVGASAINPDIALLRDGGAFVQTALASGFSLIPWTANGPVDWRLALDLGASGVFTDFPGRLRGFLDHSSAASSAP